MNKVYSSDPVVAIKGPISSMRLPPIRSGNVVEPTKERDETTFPSPSKLSNHTEVTRLFLFAFEWNIFAHETENSISLSCPFRFSVLSGFKFEFRDALMEEKFQEYRWNEIPHMIKNSTLCSAGKSSISAGMCILSVLLHLISRSRNPKFLQRAYQYTFCLIITLAPINLSILSYIDEA
ncbi:hypothetical protein HDU76_010992, partial [Blyttiomyces sp. JEL0837]